MQANSPPAQPSVLDATLHRVREAFAANNDNDTEHALAEALVAANDFADRNRVASLCRQLGRLDMARAIYRESALKHDDLQALDSLVQMQSDHDGLDTDRLEAQFTTASVPGRLILGFTLGKIFHDRGDTERAFRYLLGGNEAMKAYSRLEIRGGEKRLDFVREYFTPELFASRAAQGYAPARPIFIVGMPRCGSTLTEQVISSHPDVYAGGEMPLIDRVLARATRHGRVRESRLLATATPEAFGVLGQMYWDTVKQVIGHSSHITDKYLNNIWALGYIRLMFPNARVIHVTRDPLDNGFAIFRRKFASVPFAYDLAAIGKEMRLQHDLAQYWDQILPGFVHRVKYEDLVADFEPQARRLIDYCGLEWNDACLQFHRNKRGIRTSSVTQVRQPLFTDSIGSAKPYRPFMQPFLDAYAASYTS